MASNLVFKRVGVIGFGQMGQGIAQAAAMSGTTVTRQLFTVLTNIAW